MKKPPWVIEKERARRGAARETLWLFGLHAVRDALLNPARERLRLVVTRNALDRLGEAVAQGPEPEIADPRRFPVPLDPGSVHQGAALEVRPLDWGAPEDHADGRPLVLLDRVTDPHNVGAVLRSAEVFGAAAVIAPARHAAPETGALAKAASGALERQPYLRVANLAGAMTRLREAGYALLGLDGAADATLEEALVALAPRPVGPRPGRRRAGAPRAHARDLRRARAHPLRGGVRLAQRLERGRGGALRRVPPRMTTKIATCCYCGARAALRLDRGRHELACAACGAPLREMKALRAEHGAAAGEAPGIVTPSKVRGTRKAEPLAAGALAALAAGAAARRKGKRRSLGRKLLSEAWDLVEDILD